MCVSILDNMDNPRGSVKPVALIRCPSIPNAVCMFMASPLKYPHQVQSRLSDDAHAWLLVNRRPGETEAEQLRRLVEERRTGRSKRATEQANG